MATSLSCQVTACLEIIVGSTTLLELNDLVDNTATPPAVVTGATVTALVKDATTLVNIAGITQPIAMPEIGAPSGNYRGTIAATAVITPGQRLRIEVTADAGGGTIREFVIPASGIEC